MSVVRRRVYPTFGQASLRALVVLGTLLGIVAAQAAGSRPAQWLVVLTVVFAVVLAVRPDSVAGIGVLGGTAYVWLAGATPGSAWLLAVVAGLVVAHVAATLAAQGPALAPVDPVQARRWLLRGAGLWLAAVLVWGLPHVVAAPPGGRLVYAGGLLLLSVVAVVTTLRLSSRPG